MNIEDTEDTPVSPSSLEELPRITATYNELQEVKAIEAVEASSEQGKPIEKPATPLLNRAQRRSLRRYIAHKAALQVRHVLAKRRKMATKQAKIAKAFAKQAKYVAGTIS